MLATIRAERLFVPATPAVAEAQPGQPRHQIELGRVGVAKHHREEAEVRLKESVEKGPDAKLSVSHVLVSNTEV